MAGPPAGTSAADLGLEELSGEPSRGELFAQMRIEDAANDPARASRSQTFALAMHFRFPTDVGVDVSTGKPRVDSLFGIDISHHQLKTFPIELLRSKQVLFLYIKASQGTTFVDPKFADFWYRAGKLPKGREIHRGPYHFLSAGDPSVDAASWGRQQAATFLKVINANNANQPYRDTDMPPVMDLEWDRAKADAPDRWKGRSANDILAMANAFLQAVRDGLKRQGATRMPIVYTAQSWWHERIGQDSRLAELPGYPIWLADYTAKSRTPETPRTINGAKWALWQFTENAQMPIGYSGGFDANIFKGKRADFYARLGVKEFQ